MTTHDEPQSFEEKIRKAATEYSKTGLPGDREPIMQCTSGLELTYRELFELDRAAFETGASLGRREGFAEAVEMLRSDEAREKIDRPREVYTEADSLIDWIEEMGPK